MKKKIGRIKNNNPKHSKILIISIPSLIILVILVALIGTGSLSKLMGNSVITEYYCEQGYELKGTNCVQTLKTKAALLGDINLDGNITEDDLKKIDIFLSADKGNVNSTLSSTIASDVKLSNLALAAADINYDQEINETDMHILSNFINKENTTSSNYYNNQIGIKKVCELDYKLNGNYCIKEVTKNALVKESQATESKNKTNEKVEIIITDNLKGQTSLAKYAGVKLTINFKINDKQNQYYYKTKAYIDGKQVGKEVCNIVPTTPLVQNFSIEGDTNETIIVYSDSSCSKEVKRASTENYLCVNGCDNNKVTITANQNATSVKKGTKINFDIKVDLKKLGDNKQYYYKWNTFTYGKSDKTSKCEKLTSQNLKKQMTINGRSFGQLYIYNDEKCKSNIQMKNTQVYNCSDCTNQVDVKIQELSQKKYKYGTGEYLTVNFDVKDQQIDYYYNWSLYKYGKQSFVSNCVAVPRSGSSKVKLLIEGKTKGAISIYSDKQCKNYVKKQMTKEYSCSDCKDVIISTDKSEHTYNEGTTIITPAIFTINDNSKTYYYRFEEFVNGKRAKTTSCNKLTDGEKKYSFNLDYSKNTYVVLYSDNSCSSQLEKVSTGKFNCNDCKPVSVNIAPLQGSTNLTKGTTVHVGIDLKVNDPSKTYYYAWESYDESGRNGRDCEKVSTGSIIKNLTIYGNTSATMTIYEDKHCTKIAPKSPLYTTQQFTCSNCNVIPFIPIPDSGSSSNSGESSSSGEKGNNNSSQNKVCNSCKEGYALYNKNCHKISNFCPYGYEYNSSTGNCEKGLFPGCLTGYEYNNVGEPTPISEYCPFNGKKWKYDDTGKVVCNITCGQDWIYESKILSGSSRLNNEMSRKFYLGVKARWKFYWYHGKLKFEEANLVLDRQIENSACDSYK